MDLMDYKVVVNHIYCPIGSNPNGVILLLVASFVSNRGWLQTSHIATYPSIIFKLWPVNLPPLKRTLHSFPLISARCSTPHFLVRGGRRNGWRPAIGSFIERPEAMGDWLDILPSWQSCNDLPELGRTVGTGVENGGGTVGGTFFWWVP